MVTPDLTTITTREYASELAEDAQEADGIVALDGVEFISRAAADELLHHEETNKISLDVSQATEQVEKMVSLVRDSRESQQEQVPDHH